LPRREGAGDNRYDAVSLTASQDTGNAVRGIFTNGTSRLPWREADVYPMNSRGIPLIEFILRELARSARTRVVHESVKACARRAKRSIRRRVAREIRGGRAGAASESGLMGFGPA
jgi:hypothetical protein